MFFQAYQKCFTEKNGIFTKQNRKLFTETISDLSVDVGLLYF